MVFICDLETGESWVFLDDTQQQSSTATSATGETGEGWVFRDDAQRQSSTSATGSPSEASASGSPSEAAASNSYAAERVASIARFTSTSFTPHAYCLRFGTPTPEEPWGGRFWLGMLDTLSEYAYRGQLQQHPGSTPPSIPCWFTLPGTFSKKAARTPRCEISNPASADVYPAWACRWSDEQFKVACFNIVVQGSRPWNVHISWLTCFANVDQE